MKKLDENLLRTFKIDISNEEKFDYFSFNIDTKYSESWDIFGVHFSSDNKIVLRLMHFEDEMFEDEMFSPVKLASPFVSLKFLDYLNFLNFIRFSLLKKEKETNNGVYFELLDAEELLKFHYPKSLLTSGVGRWYRYKENDASDNGLVSLISIPLYNKKYGNNQSLSLRFVTLEKSHLIDEHFNLLFSSHGLGTISFSKEALEDLVNILSKVVD
ncbi:hypothetical protein [Dictyobacter kobayashii]|uniref:Uncharacterized protein n=1 Tax=Dictyobacter kobayashii TaxID=2014872 RepID=A0A402AVL0_9CHLR|nr:hypothetical protein [Dictyobacter kobayashii]GCE23146.1 hypothetical protein KDK_69460 [Dictyobacter kobayashii]